MTHAELVADGPGVWAAIAKPDRGAIGNAAIVDLGDPEPEPPAHVRDWGQPEMWRANVEALR